MYQDITTKMVIPVNGHPITATIDRHQGQLWKHGLFQANHQKQKRFFPRARRSRGLFLRHLLHGRGRGSAVGRDDFSGCLRKGIRGGSGRKLKRGEGHTRADCEAQFL